MSRLFAAFDRLSFEILLHLMALLAVVLLRTLVLILA